MTRDDIDIFDPGNIPADMYRRDGSVKSSEGYLGPQTNKHDGKIMTELSIGVEIDGREVEIPAMVPTLTQSEIEILRNIRVGIDPIPRSIQQKAVDHAMPLLNSGKSPFFQGFSGSSVSDIDIFDPQYANPQLRGQHPGDNADLSALGIIPDMAKGFINDAYRYGKQALTGDLRTDEELLYRPELRGDAATISDMLGQGMGAAMNYRGLLSTPEFPLPSTVDVLGGALGMYQNAKPELIDIFGEPGVNQVEGTALLGSMILPGRVRQATKTGLYSQAAESALDLQRKSGNVQGYINDLTGKGRVKPDELRAIGFEDYFAGRNDIPRQEVQQYINDNQIRLDETILRDATALPERTSSGEPDYENIARNATGRAKYSSYTLGGGDQNNNYREILIQLPYKSDVVDQVHGLRIEYSNLINRTDDVSVARKAEIKQQLIPLEAQYNSEYQGGHYPDVDNVAMTLRLNDRVDVEGKKGLLIEEIQDDWASAGNDLGYKNIAETKALSKELDRLEEINNSYLKQQQEFEIQGIPEDIEFTTKAVRNYRDTLDARYRLQEVLSKEENLLPDRPFKSTDKSSDYSVAIKRALVEAANGDYDRLYLTTGQQQADRYDLSKSINEVRLDGDEIIGFTVSAFDKNDAPVIMETIKSLDELPALIGKDAAKAIVDQPITDTTFGSARILAGQDLSIGGEGMKQFYDKTYRNALGKMVKPYGVKVGQADLPSDYQPEIFQVIDDANERAEWLDVKSQVENYGNENSLVLKKYDEFVAKYKPKTFRAETVYSVDITPKMREDFKKGIPMFAGGGAVDTTDIFEYNLGGSVSQMMRDPNEKRGAGPTGPQVANFAANFPPGAATLDAFGGMPGMVDRNAGYVDIFSAEPNLSAKANIEQGNYGTAFMQGMGVLGDLITPIPLAGTLLGAALKAPRAIQKAGKLSKAAKTGGIDSLPQDIVRVGDGIESIDAARIVSSKATLTKKQTITALKNQFMSEHPAVGRLTTVNNKPKVVDEALIRRRANAYVKKMEAVPAVFRREAYRLDQNIQTIPMQQRNIIHPEALIGKTGVPVVGDRSIRLVGDDKAGRGIMSIRGVPLSSEHIPQGGMEYSIDNLGRPISLPDGSTSNRGWASMEDAANKKQANMLLAATETDSDDILGIYSAMSRNSINFSADALIPMMKQLPAIRIPKKDIKAFDEAIRKGVRKTDGDGKVTTTARPDWLGLEHPEVFDQLLGKGDFPKDGAGAFRKTIIEEMMKKKWENLGFPLYDDMIDTMTVPALGGFMQGESGLSMFKADPLASTFDDLDHLSYGTSIPGEYFGGLKGSVPPEVMYPEMFDMLSKKITAPKKGTPRPLSYDEQVGSLMMDPKLYEQYTPEKVEKIIEYMNKNLGTDYAKGGEVSADLIDIFDV
jgi:hypothetical protein